LYAIEDTVIELKNIKGPRRTKLCKMQEDYRTGVRNPVEKNEKEKKVVKVGQKRRLVLMEEKTRK